MSDLKAKRDGLLEKLDAFEEDIVKHFQEAGLGKDLLLRALEGLAVARNGVKTAPLDRQGHDLNDDLAENPEDHPAVHGQGEKPDIQLEDPKSVPEGAYQAPEAPDSAKDMSLPGNQEHAEANEQANEQAE